MYKTAHKMRVSRAIRTSLFIFHQKYLTRLISIIWQYHVEAAKRVHEMSFQNKSKYLLKDRKDHTVMISSFILVNLIEKIMKMRREIIVVLYYVYKDRNFERSFLKTLLSIKVDFE